MWLTGAARVIFQVLRAGDDTARRHAFAEWSLKQASADQTQAGLAFVFQQAKAVRELVVGMPPPKDVVSHPSAPHGRSPPHSASPLCRGDRTQADSIAAAYRDLCSAVNVEDVPVAVRSSATTEDTAEASFAGQHDTFLNQKGAGDVMSSVRRCWASIFTDRAVECVQSMLKRTQPRETATRETGCALVAMPHWLVRLAVRAGTATATACRIRTR